MSKLSKLAAVIAVVPVLTLSASAFADGNPGQIETGDIYRVRNLTTSSAFADNTSAVCGNTVQFRVRIHNSGPETLTNVNVAATLNTANGTSHGSTVTVTADNNLHGASATANAGVTTAANTTATYIAGSTQLLDYSATPGGESVIRNLADGIVGAGVNIGSVGPTTPETEEVQFSAKLNCATTPPPVTPPTVLVNTGAGSVAGIAAVVAIASAAAFSLVSRRLSRQ
jgi:uncharacterized repeat protein (TIGR01451 family)